jgi:hypothetical protein
LQPDRTEKSKNKKEKIDSPAPKNQKIKKKKSTRPHRKIKKLDNQKSKIKNRLSRSPQRCKSYM